jgi:uncharacterized DUF497 family protein
MVVLESVTGFEWDEGNTQKSVEEHGVSNIESEEIFFNQPLIIVEDVKHSQLEIRFHALGITNSGRLLFITFTIRRGKIRVISARDMHKKEKTIYEQA